MRMGTSLRPYHWFDVNLTRYCVVLAMAGEHPQSAVPVTVKLGQLALRCQVHLDIQVPPP